MRLSTRGRFAITAMIDLALRESDHPVPLQDIAVRHHISLSYLEQVFAKLRHEGLVESTRGPGGGYTLGRKADSITVADIVCAIDEAPAADQNGQADETARLVQDMTQELWASLHAAVVAHMKTVSLGSLAREQRAKGFHVEERKRKTKGVFQKPKLEPLRVHAPNSVFALGQWVPSRA